MSKKKVSPKVEEVKVSLPEIALQGPLAEVYKMFVSELSSGEQEVYLNNPGKAIFAFKKFLNDMEPEKMAKLVEYSAE
jgi:hypothetical protein